MSNIATVFKSEISRVARKEVRSEILALRKAVGVQRAQIAELRRRSQTLEQQVSRLQKSSAKTIADVQPPETSGARRFSAKGLASQRRRLGISAADCGLLVGASSQSVYNWETGKARPQAKHLSALGGLKALGKRDIAALLKSAKAAA